MRGQQGQRHRNNKCKGMSAETSANMFSRKSWSSVFFEEYVEKKVNRELRLMWAAEAWSRRTLNLPFTWDRSFLSKGMAHHICSFETIMAAERKWIGEREKIKYATAVVQARNDKGLCQSRMQRGMYSKYFCIQKKREWFW